MCDGKRIENVKPLVLYFCLSNIDNDDEPIVKTQNISEIIKSLIDQKDRYGSNWNENLLFSVESENGTVFMMVDVAHIEMFV